MTRKSHDMNANERLRDISAKLSEHFTDYVVVARIKDGLVWRFSDRTFAMGAADRIKDQLIIADRMINHEDK